MSYPAVLQEFTTFEAVADTTSSHFLSYVDSIRNEFINWCISQIGTLYQWGGRGPGLSNEMYGYDCSGFVSRALYEVISKYNTYITKDILYMNSSSYYVDWVCNKKSPFKVIQRKDCDIDSSVRGGQILIFGKINNQGITDVSHMEISLSNDECIGASSVTNDPSSIVSRDISLRYNARVKKRTISGLKKDTGYTILAIIDPFCTASSRRERLEPLYNKRIACILYKSKHELDNDIDKFCSQTYSGIEHIENGLVYYVSTNDPNRPIFFPACIDISKYIADIFTLEGCSVLLFGGILSGRNDEPLFVHDVTDYILQDGSRRFIYCGLYLHGLKVTNIDMQISLFSESSGFIRQCDIPIVHLM